VQFQLAVYVPQGSAADALVLHEQSLATRAPDLDVRRTSELAHHGVALWATQDFATPSAEDLAYFGMGIEPADRERAANPASVVVAEWRAPQSQAFAHNRLGTEVAHEVANAVGGWVWDGDTRQLFAPAALRQMRVESWGDGLPLARTHFSMHLYDNGGYTRAVTLGLNKFGLPDLVVNGAILSDEAILDLTMNLLVQQLVEGAQVGPGGELALNPSTVQHTLARQSFEAVQDEEADGRAPIYLRVSTPEEGDAENRLWEVNFGESTADERMLAQVETFRALFGDGEEDPVHMVDHDDSVLQAAWEKAEAELLALKPTFSDLRAEACQLTVKGPFDTSAGGTEWMWVDVQTWTGATLRGALINDPDDVPGLKYGSMVDVGERETFDYRLVCVDGRNEGWHTTRILAERAGIELEE